ncbi:hypothetical protein B0H13DRAFT_1647791 [Mycena leptocephala]|nr:hypothetical protein B0H13DRAFT_1647791 [Mycena leptocephala]
MNDVSPVDVPFAWLCRIDDLWFSNDTRHPGKRYYIPRLQSVLCARSSVFRDMVAFPQPDVAAESLESSPVVRLHDCAADVEVFLRAIFDSRYGTISILLYASTGAVDIHVVLDILRLAHKYDIQYLYRRALRHLGTGYPTSLADLAKDLDALNGSVTGLYINKAVPLGFTVIQAVAQVGALWLLRSAYYFLCSHPVHTIIEEAVEQWNCLSPAQRQPSLRADLHWSKFTSFFTLYLSIVSIPKMQEHPIRRPERPFRSDLECAWQ